MEYHAQDSTDPAGDSAGNNSQNNDELSFDDLMTEVAALGNHAADYAAVKVDALRARLRGLAMGILFRVCGILIAFITISTLSVYTLRGVRGAMEAATQRAWLADLLTGVIGLCAAGAGMWIHQTGVARRARDRMVLKHEQRKSRYQQADRATQGSSPRCAA